MKYRHWYWLYFYKVLLTTLFNETPKHRTKAGDITDHTCTAR